MKTALTEIIEDMDLPDDAQAQFMEAEICYKAGAYRAALLMSYTGWGLTLRERILNAKCPNGIASGQWDLYQNKSRDDDSWDQQIFDLTQSKSDSTRVFCINDDLRDQVKYWKYRRHDCAHAKANKITHVHVEAFWLFIQSNLQSFCTKFQGLQKKERQLICLI